MVERIEVKAVKVMSRKPDVLPVLGFEILYPQRLAMKQTREMQTISTIPLRRWINASE